MSIVQIFFLNCLKKLFFNEIQCMCHRYYGLFCQFHRFTVTFIKGQYEERDTAPS